MPTPTLVQHVSTSNSLGNGITANGGVARIRLAELSLPGNLLVCAFQYGNAATFTCSDDKGSTWTQGPNTFDSGNSQGATMFYLKNCTAGIHVVQIKNTHATVAAQFFSAVASEFYNVDTAAPADGAGNGNNANNVANVTITAGLLGTLGASGDLLYHYAALDTSTNGAGLWHAGSQANITWKLLSADLQDGQAAQYGIYSTTTSLNPTMTTTNARSWNSVSMAFKAATAGTAPSATNMRVVAIHHLSLPRTGNTMSANAVSNPTLAQVPNTGNLIVAAHATGSPNFQITSMSDNVGGAWEQSGGGIFYNNTNDGAQIWYGANRTSPSTDLQVTINFQQIDTSDATILFYDVVNAAAVQNDLERTGSATGNEPGKPLTLVTCSIQPSTANGLVIFAAQWEFNTANGMALTNSLFDACEYDGMPVDGPENFDQNGGWAHYYNPDTSSVTCTWNFLVGANNTSLWGAYAAAFKSVQTEVINYSRPLHVRPRIFRPGIAR